MTKLWKVVREAAYYTLDWLIVPLVALVIMTAGWILGVSQNAQAKPETFPTKTVSISREYFSSRLGIPTSGKQDISVGTIGGGSNPHLHLFNAKNTGIGLSDNLILMLEVKGQITELEISRTELQWKQGNFQSNPVLEFVPTRSKPPYCTDMKAPSSLSTEQLQAKCWDSNQLYSSKESEEQRNMGLLDTIWQFYTLRITISPQDLTAALTS